MMLKCLQDEILDDFKELEVENGMSVYVKYLIELHCNSKVYAVSLLIFYFLINKGDPVIIYPFQLTNVLCYMYSWYVILNDPTCHFSDFLKPILINKNVFFVSIA